MRGQTMKRYTEKDLPIVKNTDCIICGRKGGRASRKRLVGDGWIASSQGMVCPSCPEQE